MSFFTIVDYKKYSFHVNCDQTIKKMWKHKMEEIITRNPEMRQSLGFFTIKELSKGGSMYDIGSTYNAGKNKLFILLDEYENIIAFGGISRYSQSIYEINKLCLSNNEFANNFLIKILVKYYDEVISTNVTELQAIVERKNVDLYNLMVKNGFREYHQSKTKLNIYLKYPS